MHALVLERLGGHTATYINSISVTLLVGETAYMIRWASGMIDKLWHLVGLWAYKYREEVFSASKHSNPTINGSNSGAVAVVDRSRLYPNTHLEIRFVCTWSNHSHPPWAPSKILGAIMWWKPIDMCFVNWDTYSLLHSQLAKIYMFPSSTYRFEWKKS